MGGVGVLVIFGLFSVGFAIDLNIPSNERPVFLQPQLNGDKRVETQWNLKACSGCKLVLTCRFNTYHCERASITIDKGGLVNRHCPEAASAIAKTSIKNVMSVTIVNVGPDPLASCNVKASESYLDQPEVLIDSSEHGLEFKAKRNASCRCGWANKSPARILGGKETGINEYPFIAQLVLRSSLEPFCGGSIITVRHILTASHCTEPFTEKQLSVVVGEHDTTTSSETQFTKIIEVELVIQHEYYDPITQNNDIAMLFLKEDIPLSDYVGRVCLPLSQPYLQDKYVKVMGWGLTNNIDNDGDDSPVLRKVNLKVIDIGICNTIYSMAKPEINQICTYSKNKDSCEGDSGGPLVRVNPGTNMFEQIGLVSFGGECGSTEPGVSTSVGFYIDWIRGVIEDTKEEEICV